jgi:EAL domain-containing protein (putative c-di-GMP-specific phosphodiesterase class I)
MKALFEASIRPHLLQLELTESLLMRDVDDTIEVLRYLKEAGVTLAIDDFGTGYSSLSYLKRFPIDLLKIDRSFVKDLEESRDSAAICAAIIAMAHQLGLSVVAEGIETPGQLAFLRENGCEQGQGFLLGRPASAQDLEQSLLESTRKTQTAKSR